MYKKSHSCTKKITKRKYVSSWPNFGLKILTFSTLLLTNRWRLREEDNLMPSFLLV